MLLLKPNCECCDISLAPDDQDARICSFECTFCVQCAQENFDNVCPNCDGELIRRPTRPTQLLKQYPASNKRFINPKHAKENNYSLRRAENN